MDYDKMIQEIKEILEDGFKNAQDTVEHIREVVRPKLELVTSDETFEASSDLVTDKDFALYSDGACRGNPGPGAYGALSQSLKGDLLFELSGVDMSTTNNRMEMEGAYEGLARLKEYLLDQGKSPTEMRVFLYTDSKLLVNGMNEWLNGWKSRGWKKADKKEPTNLDLWKKLDLIKDDFKEVVFKWVKGHAGHPQNERCDQIANQALDEAGF